MWWWKIIFSLLQMSKDVNKFDRTVHHRIDGKIIITKWSLNHDWICNTYYIKSKYFQDNSTRILCFLLRFPEKRHHINFSRTIFPRYVCIDRSNSIIEISEAHTAVGVLLNGLCPSLHYHSSFITKLVEQIINTFHHDTFLSCWWFKHFHYFVVCC